MNTIVETIKEQQRINLEQYLQKMLSMKTEAGVQMYPEVVTDAIRNSIESHKKGKIKFPGEVRGYYKKHLLQPFTKGWYRKHEDGEMIMYFQLPADKEGETKTLKIDRDARYKKIQCSVRYNIDLKELKLKPLDPWR